MSAAEALAPEQSVDEVREGLSVTEKGQPANTIGNCRTVFCHDPLLRDAIRLNLLTDRVDIVRDLGWRRNTSALTLMIAESRTEEKDVMTKVVVNLINKNN